MELENRTASLDMADPNSIESLELSPIKSEKRAIYQDLDVLCFVIHELLSRYGSDSMSYAAININGDDGEGISLSEFHSELINLGIYNDQDCAKIEYIFEQFDMDQDGYLNHKDWVTSFQVFPTRLGNLEAQSSSQNSDIISIIENQIPSNFFTDQINPTIPSSLVPSSNNIQAISQQQSVKDPNTYPIHNLEMYRYKSRMNNHTDNPQKSHGIPQITTITTNYSSNQLNKQRLNIEHLSTGTNNNNNNNNENEAIIPYAQPRVIQNNQIHLNLGGQAATTTTTAMNQQQSPQKDMINRSTSQNQLRQYDEQIFDLHLSSKQLFTSSANFTAAPLSSTSAAAATAAYLIPSSQQSNNHHPQAPIVDPRSILSQKIIHLPHSHPLLAADRATMLQKSLRSLSNQRIESSRMPSPSFQPSTSASSQSMNPLSNIHNNVQLSAQNAVVVVPQKMRTNFESYLSRIGLGSSRTSVHCQKLEGATRNDFSPLQFRVPSGERANAALNSRQKPQQLSSQVITTNFALRRQGLENIIDRINTKKGNLWSSRREGGQSSYNQVNNQLNRQNLNNNTNPIKTSEIDSSLEKIRLISAFQKPNTLTDSNNNNNKVQTLMQSRQNNNTLSTATTTTTTNQAVQFTHAINYSQLSPKRSLFTKINNPISISVSLKAVPVQNRFAQFRSRSPDIFHHGK